MSKVKIFSFTFCFFRIASMYGNISASLFLGILLVELDMLLLSAFFVYFCIVKYISIVI